MKNKANSPFPEDVSMPNVVFSGENYEVTGQKAQMASIIGYVRMLAFGFLFGGSMFFDFFGGVDKFPDAIKDLHVWVQENKW